MVSFLSFFIGVDSAARAVAHQQNTIAKEIW